MINIVNSSGVIINALIATLITWFITSLGAGIVFFFKKVNKNILDAMMSLSAGVMLSAAFFSLLLPAIESAKSLNMNNYLIPSIGFLLGTLFLLFSDHFFENYLQKKKIKKVKSMKRSIMLVFSITLHNIPEGLAIGVAFGSVLLGIPNATLIGAYMLAIGIAIQNFPEGSAISLPLRREGYSRFKSFLWGFLSGIVEPIAGVVGCILVIYVRSIMPIALSFASGAMIYVAISELIPESSKNKHKKLISLSLILGFIIMMILDISLG